jgi:hypothetical protein
MPCTFPGEPNLSHDLSQRFVRGISGTEGGTTQGQAEVGQLDGALQILRLAGIVFLMNSRRHQRFLSSSQGLTRSVRDRFAKNNLPLGRRQH